MARDTKQTKDAKQEELMEKLSERVFMYSVLRRVFIEPPNTEVVELFLDPEVKSAFKTKGKAYKEGIKLIEAYFKRCKKEKLDPVKCANEDYISTYAFGKDHVYPYESIYLSKKKWLFQEVTINVRNSYFDQDLAPKMLFSDPDDHVGLELDFLRLMAERTLKAAEKRNIKNLKKNVEDTARFLVEHPLKWFDKFAERTMVKAGTEFYRGMGLILDAYVKDDVEDLKTIYLDLQELAELEVVGQEKETAGMN